MPVAMFSCEKVFPFYRILYGCADFTGNLNVACGLLLTMRINSGGPLTAQNNNTDEREGNGELFSENGREGKQQGTLVLPFVSNDVGQNFNPNKSIAVNSFWPIYVMSPSKA